MQMKKLGKAWINISEIVAGTAQNWILTYETGDYGIDDSGEILVARRDVCDSDIPQFENPFKPGFVKVWSDSEVKLLIRYIPDRYIRPWKSCISIKISDGSLKKGDRVYVEYGAKEGQGAGYRIQTYAEGEHIFKVLVDCAGSGNFYGVEPSPFIRVTGGYLYKVEAVAPSLVEPGEKFDILVRAMDSWGNIADKCDEKFYFSINGIKSEISLRCGIGKISGVAIKNEGVYYPRVFNTNERCIGVGNPVKCIKEANTAKLYWGDMHGQTKETVGTGSLDLYFAFGRDKAGLDFSAWQGNDFQVTDDTWQAVCDKVKEYHEPGRFVTFLGYEWSGTTPCGGDYNIYYLDDDQPIYRSYRWQIGMDKSDGSDRSPISSLWKEFESRDDVMAIPHVGGRYGNLDFCDDNFVKLLEIHSHHGTFEWFFEDALKKGLKLGIVAASDDHTCRPGLSYPTRITSRGFVSFDVIGGYTGVYAEDLTRKSLWDALKKRHCYGTTGSRIIVDVKCGESIMGDEVFLDKKPVIDVKVAGTGIISDVLIMRGLETVYSYSPSLPLRKDTVKIQWSGVKVRSRGKKVCWDGQISIQNGKIINAAKFAFNQPDEGITLMSNQVLQLKSNTSGDIDGLELELECNGNTKINFSTAQTAFSVGVDELKKGTFIKDAGGVNCKVEVSLAREEVSRAVCISFEDRQVKKGLNPYWVKVVQRDGHMAWSSPIYVNY